MVRGRRFRLAGWLGSCWNPAHEFRMRRLRWRHVSGRSSLGSVRGVFDYIQPGSRGVRDQTGCCGKPLLRWTTPPAFVWCARCFRCVLTKTRPCAVRSTSCAGSKGCVCVKAMHFSRDNMALTGNADCMTRKIGSLVTFLTAACLLLPHACMG